MQLYEATYDDILLELKGRYPDGVLIVCSTPADEDGLDNTLLIGYHKLIPAVGLARLALDLISEEGRQRMTHREVEEGDEEE